MIKLTVKSKNDTKTYSKGFDSIPGGSETLSDSRIKSFSNSYLKLLDGDMGINTTEMVYTKREVTLDG